MKPCSKIELVSPPAEAKTTETDQSSETTIQLDYTLGNTLDVKFEGKNCDPLKIESASVFVKTGEDGVSVTIIDTGLEGSDLEVVAIASVDVDGETISHKVTWNLSIKGKEEVVEAEVASNQASSSAGTPD